MSDQLSAFVHASDIDAVFAEIGIVHVNELDRYEIARPVREIDFGSRNEPRAVRVIVAVRIARYFDDLHTVARTEKRFASRVFSRDVYGIIGGNSERTVTV